MVTSRLLGPLAALSLSLFVPVSALAQQAQAGDETWNRALARYQETIKRKPFCHHTEGREGLASTRRPDALTMLAADYLKPQAYPEYTKYTIGTMIGRNFDRLEDLSPLTALRRGNTKPVDTWLWIEALTLEIDRTDDSEALALVRDGKDVHLRAAAIAAVGKSRAGNIKAAILPVCLDFPKKESDRNLLIGAMTGALWENKKRVNSEEYREACEAYVSLMAKDVGLGHTIKVQMARHLQLIFDAPGMFVDPEPWLDILHHKQVNTGPATGTSASPSFFGITTEGERLCYILDMSDSMLKEIEPSAKPDMVPETGPTRKKKKKRVLDESDLPWHKIVTRWDLAREQMRISLSRLTPDKHFAVVWFGDTSGTLKATKGMIKATKANIDRVMAELDEVKKDDSLDAAKQETRAMFPNGKLRGDTNLHSGMKRAFGLAGKGFVEEAAYVDPEALTEGCDTIFLVSDGKPSVDDFVMVDKNHDGVVGVKNMESGASGTKTPDLVYFGPYNRDDWLIEDVRRMNVFRRITIHAIGIGEANMDLLERLAEIGNGESFSFGKKETGGGKGDK